MLPYVANEWLKDYITQLIELEMLEVCSGPWAAAVVLEPNNKEERQPKRRFKKVKKIPKIVTVPGEKIPKQVWTVSVMMNSIDQEELLPELSSLEEVQH